MNPNESVEDFVLIFLHLSYVFPKEDVDWDFFNENFQYLVEISFKKFEFESVVDFTLPTFLDHEAPQPS